MSFEKQHLAREASGEAKKIICSALSVIVVLYSTGKKWFQQFREGTKKSGR